MEINLLILFLALLADRYFGDPEWLWAKIPHPVVIFGRAIDFADKRFNKPANSDYERRRNGLITMLGLLALAAAVGFFVDLALRTISPFGELIEALIVAVFLAQKSLGDHVTRVAVALREEGIVGARKAVSMIVGRDSEVLDDAAVSRAAIESLAENTSDGIIAPAFWYALFGLPGLLAYKVLNTADSMIGHMNDRHRDFGRFAAKLDDVANWILGTANRPPDFSGGVDLAWLRCGTPIVQCDDARCAPAPLAQCGMAGGRDGWGNRSGPGGAARLWRRHRE